MRITEILLIVAAMSLAIVLTGCPGSEPEEQPSTAPAPAETAAVPPATEAPPVAAAIPTSWTGDAINFSFTTADGTGHLAEEYAGKPLVVNFWAAW